MNDRDKLLDLLQDGDCPAWFISNEQRAGTVDYLISKGVTVSQNPQKEEKRMPENEKLGCPMSYNVPPEMSVRSTYTCIESRCAGWCEDAQKCALLVMAEALRKVAKK